MSSKERRLSPRKDLQLGVTLELPSSRQPLAAKLLNMSLAGAFIETEAMLSTSSPLIVALKLSESGLQNGFRIYARVIRCTETGVGVAFLPMPLHMTNALGEAMSRYELQLAGNH